MQTIEHEDYIIESCAQGNLSRIAQPKGGKVPEALGGLWTTPEVAKRAINGYQAKQAAKEAAKRPAKVKLTPRIQKED